MQTRNLFLLFILLGILRVGTPAMAAGTAFCDSVSEIPTAECKALILILDNMDGENWWLGRNDWGSDTTPCDWYGVTCSSGNVTELNLSQTIIRTDGAIINATIPAEISDLTKLEVLDLSYANDLVGGLPTSFSALTNLRVLNLNFADQLTGDIETMFVDMPQLEELRLQQNQLTGKLPTLHMLANLKHIDLAHNEFNGAFDSTLPPEWGQLSQLETLHLNFAFAVAAANYRPLPPEYGNLSNLIAFTACGNNIRSQIPSEYGNLSQLTHLNLCGNRLYGSVPPEAGMLSALTSLSLQGNDLTGVLPSELGNLNLLTQLNIADNNLTGPLPLSLGNLPLTQFSYNMTQLCEPGDSAMQNWLNAITTLTGTGQSCDGFSLLAMVALAFDNRPNSTGNLQHHYQATIDELIAASALDARKKIVVLADLNNQELWGQDHILVIENGAVSAPIYAKPFGNGSLDYGTAYEYNMTDGGMLGAFIKWARSNYPTTHSTFSFVGHGTFAVPDADVAALFAPSGTRNSTPLPWTVGTPDFTDENTTLNGSQPGLISPVALAEALRIGSDDGANPITVVDLVHCFSASIEALYEMSNGDVTVPEYAERFVASPSYTYFDTSMLAQAVIAMEPASDADAIAEAVIHAYNDVLAIADGLDGDPSTIEHPRSIVALNSDMLVGVKLGMDLLAEIIDNGMDATDRATLLSVYQNTPVYYDTTSCELDWQLSSPDGLVDLYAFVKQLKLAFASNALIQLYADIVLENLDDGIVARIAVDGTPWFAPAGTVWTLQHADARGIALFADFDAKLTGAVYYRPWQAGYYDHSAESLQFASTSLTSKTWADVLDRYWTTRNIAEGTTTDTQACLTEYPLTRAEVEMSAIAIVHPAMGPLQIGHPRRLSAAIEVDAPALNPEIRFRVLDADNTPVFTDTVTAGYLVTGTHYIESSQLWTPGTGRFTVEALLDVSDRFIESENDNLVRYTVMPGPGTFMNLTAQMSGGAQWITDQTVTLDVSASTDLDLLIMMVYQYIETADNLRRIPIHTHNLVASLPLQPTATFILPDAVKPGALTLHVWGYANNEPTQEMSIVHLNYAPTNRVVDTGTDYYRVFAEAGDTLDISLTDPAAQTTLQIWSPYNLWQPAQQIGAGTTSINATIPGEYVLAISGNTLGATYSAELLINGSRASRSTANLQPMAGSVFIEPVPQLPIRVPTSVQVSTISAETTPTIWLTATALVLTLITLSLPKIVPEIRNEQD